MHCEIQLFSASLANLASVSVSHMVARFQTTVETHCELHRKESCLTICHIFDVFLFQKREMDLDAWFLSVSSAECIIVHFKTHVPV